MLLKFLIIIFLKKTWILSSTQNCLQRNPDILDAHFHIPPKFTETYGNAYFYLFRSRFNQGHEMGGVSMEYINKAGLDAKKFTKSTGKDAALFLPTINHEESAYKSEKNLELRQQQLISNYQITLKATEKINSGSIKPVVGLYLRSSIVSSFKGKLNAVEKVFGSQKNSSIPVGEYFYNCHDTFKSRMSHQYLRRLNFITCGIYLPMQLDGAWDAAWAVSRCELLSRTAIKHKITAKIYCALAYFYSETASISKPTPQYYANFKTFWCGIVEKILKNNETGFTFVMMTAFPLYPDNYTKPDISYSYSWWEITQNSSSSSSFNDIFVERIENFMSFANPVLNVSKDSNSFPSDNLNLQYINHPTHIGNGVSENQISKDCYLSKEQFCKQHVKILPVCSWSIKLNDQHSYVKRPQLEHNCLRINPKSLDVTFGIYNPDAGPWNIPRNDYMNLLDIIYSRFEMVHENGITFHHNGTIFAHFICLKSDRNHNRNWGLDGWWMVFFPGVTSDNVERRLTGVPRLMFLGSPMPDLNLYGTDSQRLEATEQSYRKGLARAIHVNFSKIFTVKGVYINSYLLPTYKLKLEAINKVFGSRKYSVFPIAEYFPSGCPIDVQYSESVREYLLRLDFLACPILTIYQGTPEKTADAVVSLCDEMQVLAHAYSIPAKITCVVTYETKPFTSETNVSNLEDNFQRFWCRIADEVARNKHPRIVMWSAFDVTGFDISTNTTSLYIGWWRRTHNMSFKSGSFVERLEEEEGRKRIGNCSKMCEECNSFTKCCIGCCVPVTFNFSGLQATQRYICKSEIALCDPLISFVEGHSNVSEYQENFSTLTYTIVVSTVLIGSGVFVTILYVTIHKIRTKKVFTTLEINELFRGGSDSKTKTRTNEVKSSVDCGLPSEFPYKKELEIKERFFKIHQDKVLGHGAFGIVFEGTVHKKPVAVKTLLPTADKESLKSFVSELKLLSYIGYHENIVNLVGANSFNLRIGKLYMFLELCPHGNLNHYLRIHRRDFTDNFDNENDFTVFKATTVSVEFITKRNHRITFKDLVVWSIQIADAMIHLASKNVIHGDIATRNILVFNPKTVKLTDFGLSRRLHNYTNYIIKTDEPLPWRHMAPEALRDLNISLRSDVWSFGVTLWEIFSLGHVPFQGFSYSDDFIRRLEEGYRPGNPQFSSELMYEVMNFCWTTDHLFRPEIVQVKSKLCSVLENVGTCEGATSAEETIFA